MPSVRRRLTVFVAAAAIAAVPACNRTKVEGEGRLDPDGRILVTRDDKPTTVSRSRSLVTGDKVEVAEGTAKIELPGGDVLELRPRTIVVLDEGPDLRSGNLLVRAPSTRRTVRAAGSLVDAVGAVRLDVTLALRVAVYGGQATVRSGGRTFEVAGLREASVPVVGVLQGPRPLAIDRGDAWDQSLLGDAAAKEADLEDRARGFTGQVATGNATSVAYYRSLLPGLADEPAFQQADVDRLGRPAVEGGDRLAGQRFRAGDVLLGAAVALQGKRGSFADRLAGAAAFRSEGASWALVSLDQQVPSIDALIGLIDGALNVAPLEIAAPGSPPPAVVAEPPPASPTTTPRRAPRTTPTTTRANRSAPPTTTTTTAPRQQQPQPQTTPGTIKLPVDPVVDAVTDPVVDLLNSLLGNGGR